MECSICFEREQFTALRYIGNTTIYQCKKCGVVFVDPSPNDIIESYNQEKISPSTYYQETKEEDRKSFKRLLKHSIGKKLLDIGCNIGTLMLEAKEQGMEVKGIEINKIAVKIAEDKGLIIHHNTFENESFDLYDTLVMSDFLEHTIDPNEIIKKAYKMLNNQGRLIITTPNWDSSSRKVLKWDWPHFKPKEHLFYFNKQNIQMLLKNNKFKIILCTNYSRHRNLKTLIEKSPIKLLKKLIPNLNLTLRIQTGEMIIVGEKIE